MTRFEKKCLVASTGTHLFLVLLLVFGSAFITATDQQPTYPKLKFYPSNLIIAALAGGGGNPKIAPSDDVQKGNPNPNAPTVSTPPPASPPKPVQPPTPQPPAPVDPAPPKPQVKKQDPRKAPPKPEKLPEKVADKTPPTPPKHKIDLTELQPIVRTEKDKEKQRKEAEERERQRKEAEEEAKAEAQRREETRQRRIAGQRIANQLNQAVEAMQRGFASGTKVDVGGPGGEAFANYAAVVERAYHDAWRILPDLNDDDVITSVRVVINREGRVVSSEILRKSGSVLMDRSVQKALDRVRIEGLPRFPDFIKDSERSFTIEFNLKTRKLTG